MSRETLEYLNANTLIGFTAEVDPVTRTPSWRVPLSGPAGEDVLDGNNEEAEDVHPGVPA